MYEINYEFKQHGIFSFNVLNGYEFKITITPNTDIYSLVSITYDNDVTLVDGEVISIIKTILFILYSNIGKSTLIISLPNNTPNINRIIKISSRWLKNFFDYKIIINPRVHQQGRAILTSLTNQTQIFLTKKIDIKKNKFCTNCGTENTNNFKFCPNCGTNFS